MLWQGSRHPGDHVTGRCSLHVANRLGGETGSGGAMPGMGGGLAAAAGRPSATGGGGGRTTLLTMSFRDLEQTSPTDNSAARRHNGTAGPAPITDKNANNLPLVSYAQMNGAQPHDHHIYGILLSHVGLVQRRFTSSHVLVSFRRKFAHVPYIHTYIYIRLT